MTRLMIQPGILLSLKVSSSGDYLILETFFKDEPTNLVKEEPKPLVVSNNLGGGSDDEDLNFGDLDDNYGDDPLDS